MISSVFFSFFKILILWVLKRVRGQKIVQNDKKFRLSHSISQEPYIMWLSFLVHMYKMIENDDISWCVFQFFKILIFRVFRGRGGGGGVKGQKMAQNDKFCLSQILFQEPYFIWSSFMVHMCKKWPKMTKNPYHRNHTSYDCHLWYTCVKWWYLKLPLLFFRNFDFSGC